MARVVLLPHAQPGPWFARAELLRRAAQAERQGRGETLRAIALQDQARAAQRKGLALNHMADLVDEANASMGGR